MKSIILCADDYGQNPAISQAIINLIEKKRISATSCLSNMESWPEHSQWLKPYENEIDIGLHLNFTEGKPLSKRFLEVYGESFFSLKDLMVKTYLKKMEVQAIEDEINAQIEAFQNAVGFMPHYIDGHQHVHHFPLISDVLIKVYNEKLKHFQCYIRSVYDKYHFFQFLDSTYFKKVVIQLSGAFSFKQKLLKNAIPHNSSFEGIYDFSKNVNYQTLFCRFLNQIKDRGMIMCHPGLANTSYEDLIYHSRRAEYDYLSSDAFIQDCQARQITLMRMKKS